MEFMDQRIKNGIKQHLHSKRVQDERCKAPTHNSAGRLHFTPINYALQRTPAPIR